MSRFEIPDLGTHLRGKVVVLTGGALGIGSELVRLLHSSGAHVFFGDVLIPQGEALAKELQEASSSSRQPGQEGQQQVKFLYTNVQDHLANLGLFDLALETCGRVDHAVSVAGINREENIVDAGLDMEGVRKEPDIDDSLDVNLRAPILFSRIASVYLRQQPKDDTTVGPAEANKSLTLVSSVAGFTEAPGLAVYSAGKHGVYGLMRALRKVLIKPPHHIRTNAICPWMTETRMVSGIDSDWKAAGLPRNKAIDVARVIAGVMVAKVNGEALYVEGGRAWGIEEGIDKTQPLWMGEKQSRDFMKGQEVLGTGENW